ncbi:putative phosphatase regulatory subunit-domain-containing protein [Suillus subalutaceus]|uniref:putative phosphatase regulatory subunit-domain-containing protein n=1 Tax=Suillus subalutaceus TaxID=48586 RepID=UPI001B879E6A|nr:putative phosphatase regulatory subunit-domain-containing protein [Suillus subalutaceus]KAG1856669.1 putative phosphatase regulatory subunit-domain-containing protein [Suillus subalutaceus]
MSQPRILFPTDPQILQNGSDTGRFSPQTLQRMSLLGHGPWSESAMTDLLDASDLHHDKSLVDPTMDQSSILFPSTDIYQYDSSSSTSSTSSTPSDESHIVIPRSRRVRGQNSNSSSPTLLSVKARYHSSPRTYQADKKSVQSPELSDASDVDTVRLTQAPFDNAASVKPIPSRAQARQFSSEMRSSSLPQFNSHVKSQPGSPQMRSIRNKSGQPIKPSLKHAKLPSLTIPTGGGVVQSEPTTPTLSKAVHFDANLEHVKLFLSKQKPLAVSRDRDPATDTSGTESDFPSFVRGSPDDSTEKQIELQIRNMPSIPPKNADVIIQALTLSQSDKSITGRVRVRNIAYEKWVAARFTLDLWQTTSEVTAHYVESVDDGMFDIFTFTIRLHDMWSRIEEKTMFIALRYTTAGRQFWDNNNGANYMLKFVGKLVTRKVPATAGFLMEGSDPGVESARVDRDPSQASPLPRSSAALRAETPLSARYNLGSALNVAQDEGLPALSSPAVRIPTYPTELSSAWSKHTPYRVDRIPQRHARSVTIGSSRDLEKHEQAHIPQSDSLNLDPPSSTPQSRAARERNHRRGYFDRSMGGTPRKTPPGPALLSPFEDRTPTRSSDSAQGQPSFFSRFTAQNMTRMNSASSTDSSSLTTPLTSSGPNTPTSSDDKPSLNDSYSQFLNRFCFFTGSGSLTDHSSDLITRSHSASDVEALLGSSHDLSLPLRDSAFNGPRSCSLNSVSTCQSGSTTPRGNPMLDCPTPVVH